jgi:FMN reductase
VQSRLATDRTDVEIGLLVPEFGAVQQRSQVTARVEHALQQIEQADLLVVVTPVYKGSYTGHFKHFFDLVDARALVGTPVALAATGGGERHALVVEHQLRPLFGFFQAQTLPTGVYASEAEFDGNAVCSRPLLERIEAVAAEAVDRLWRGGKRDQPFIERCLEVNVSGSVHVDELRVANEANLNNMRTL